jgi:hypothetical protein
MTHAYFLLCRAFGWLLRSARYSNARVVNEGGKLVVRKRRRFYAPLLISLGEPLVRILGTGVRVLPQKEWEERERRIYGKLYGESIHVAADGTLVLPCIAGETLALVLQNPAIAEADRQRAIASAVVALADLHRMGFTHADAMAENVLIDREAGVARWFDFETVHDERRSLAWRQADDVRALLATCVVRTTAAKRAEVVRLIVDVYANPGVTDVVAASFKPVSRRPLSFHLAQAPQSFQSFEDTARLLESIRVEA